MMRPWLTRHAMIAVIGLYALGVAGCTKAIQTNTSAKSQEEAPAAVAMVATEEPREQPAEQQPEEVRTEDIAAAPALSSPVEQPPQVEPMPAPMPPREEPPAPAPPMVANLQDVYFEFDRWHITDDGRELLTANADWLRTHPDQKVTIEGHCDERGTNAYNMLLGEKRARAIRAYLVDLGVNAERLSTVSYGEDRPLCQQSHEGCYQQNRRGHLVVRSR